nr:unnamed protein product [Digitaria exilis]
MPYTTGSRLSRRRGHLADGTVLPDDVLAAVFVRLTDAADVLRCAATCKRWCRVVAKDAAIHARLLPPELARRRAFFGVFSQQALPDPVPGVADAAYHRKRKRVSGSSSVGHISSPCGLIPASAAAYRLFGFRSPYSIPLSNGGRHSALLEHSRPMMVCSSDDFKLRWFCEKSGVILFTIGEESNSPGLYTLDVATHKIQKVVDGTGYLASVACY